MTKDLAECSFMVGWDACMKHLASLPWDEAVNEIVNHIKPTVRKSEQFK